MKYIGWIKAKIEDIERLEKLGVRGSMVYNEAEGALEYCEVPDRKTLRKLGKEFPGFWRGSFSAVSD